MPRFVINTTPMLSHFLKLLFSIHYGLFLNSNTYDGCISLEHLFLYSTAHVSVKHTEFTALSLFFFLCIITDAKEKNNLH